MAKACRYSRGAHAMLNKLLLYLRVLFCFVFPLLSDISMFFIYV